jgi:Cu/Ag efflux protein CusF
MKKVWMVCLALIFAASLAGLGLAQEKAKKEEPAAAKAAPEKPPEAAKAKMVEKKEAPKPVTWRAGGVVESVDAQAKVLTIHQETIFHNRSLKLKASGEAAKELSALKPGDIVNVWIRDRVITALTKV